MSYDNQIAILLSYDHWISTLITRDPHQYGHGGIATTTVKVRKKHWIIKGSSIPKRVIKHHTFCRKLDARVPKQFMADLPLYWQIPFTALHFCTLHVTILALLLLRLEGK